MYPEKFRGLKSGGRIAARLLLLPVLLNLTLTVWPASPFSFLDKAEKHYKSARLNLPESTVDIHKIDSLLATPFGTGDIGKAYMLSTQIGLFLLEQGNHAKALDIFNDQKHYLESKTPKTAADLKRISAVYNVIGAIYEETGLWNDALEMYLLSLRICDSTGNKAGKAKVYNNIGKLYYIRNDLKKAEELYNNAIEINKELNIKPELFNNYNNLAGIYNLRHNSAKAIEYALMALNQLNIGKDFYSLSFLYSNIGNLYQDMGNFPVALTYYYQAADIQVKKSYQVSLIGSYLSISSLFQGMKMYDSSSAYISKALNIAEILNNPSQKLLAYRAAAKFFEKVKEFNTANAYYSKYTSLNDSLEKLNSLTKIEQIQAVYEVITKEKDNKILQQKVNLQQLSIQRQRILLIGAVSLVLIFIYFVFSLIRNNKRERERNQMILKQADLLHEQEKNMHLHKEQDLELKLDYKNRQLTSYALHLARNNEFVSKTTDELKQILLGLNPRDKERADRIKAMVSDLQQYSAGHDWEEFRLYFEEVHQSFEKNLTTAFPDLSPNDKKICALLKLGLSTKEIASITFRELRSVESARNRLRKKLNLSADVNIHTFLSQY
ncbi:MAG: tetratricopeptide repeat protein [Bacteroidota bacterium]